MQALKMLQLILFITLIPIGVVVIGGVAYLELFAIPAVLFEHFGQLATLVHLFSILILMLTVAAITTWFRDRTIFKIQEVLVATHLNHIIQTINNLTTGRWAADSYTHNEAFKTGAKLGFGLGYKTGEATEVDRRAILEGIQRMQLPAGEQADSQHHSQGSPASLVDDMASYLDELDSRKRRLQEQER